MNRAIKQVIAGLAAVLLVSAAAQAGSGAIASSGEPHGVVRTDVQRTASQIFPVHVVEIDGNLVSVDDSLAILLKPGQHTLKVRGSADMDSTYGLRRQIGNTGGDNELTITVEAGTTYYVGGKIDRASYWKPVIWKTEPGTTAGDS